MALGKRATGCSRMTPAQVAEADARADAIDLEIELWHADGRQSTLSDDAIREVDRRHYRRHSRPGLLAALMIAASGPGPRRL